MEGSKFEIIKGAYGPAILAIGPGVMLDCIEAFSSMARQHFPAGDTQHSLWDNSILSLQRVDARVAHWGILLLKQLLRFRRPGHQFAIEAEPVGSEFVPEAGLFGGHPKAVEELT